jgi:hypothetical protein
MGNVFTLDSLREEAERKYAPCPIELPDGTVVTLQNLIRLPSKVRTQVYDTLKLLENDDDGDTDFDAMVDAAAAVLEMVADDGPRLVKELGGDVALMMLLIERWMQNTQPGEATTSDS